MHSPAVTPRMVLCACPLHCMQVLRLAGHANLQMQGLQACTEWPLVDGAAHSDTSCSEPPHILWALLPPDALPAAKARETAWRQRLLQLTSHPSSRSIASIQMLYGNAAQQAQQLAPWIHTHTTHATETRLQDCPECLDARSEQALFSRLIRA